MLQFDRTGLADALFEETQDALFLFDPETDRILDVNPMGRRLTGFTLEELLEMDGTSMFRFEGQGGGNARLQQAANRTGIFHSQEGFVLRTKRDNIWIPVNLTITRLHVEPKTVGLISARDLREQREAHRHVQKVEAELRRVMASVSDCLWSAGVDSSGRWAFRYYSPVVETITGRPPDFFLAGPKRWWSIVHREDQPRWQKTFNQLKEVTSSQEEYRIVRADGQVRWVRDSVNVSRDTSGKPYRLDGVVTDITERKQTEAALEQERFLMHTMMANVPDFIYFKDAESRFTRINAAMVRHFALDTPAQAAGKTDFDFFTPEHAQPAYQDEQDVMKSGRPIMDKEEKETWPNGQETWVSTTKVPIRDAGGKVIGTFGISRDITRRKEAEKKLSESERRYRQLTEASLDAIIVADQGGRITLFNPAAERIFDYPAAEVLGQSLGFLMPPDHQERYRQGLQNYVLTRQSKIVGRTVEMRGRRKDGSEFPLEVSLSAIDLGGDLQFLGAIRDLTERNRMRAMVIQNEKLASIGLLSAGIAHEINNPLAYVTNNLVVLERDTQGLLSLLQAYGGVEERLAQVDSSALHSVREIAEQIDFPYVRGNMGRLLTQTRDGAQRVTRIVQSMRGLARSAPPEMEEAHLPDLVDMSLEMIRGRIQREGIVVETDYGPTKVWCVPNQLSQVFLNLLVNALHAIEKTGQTQGARIRISTQQVGGEMVIGVADTGCGIKPQDLPLLFDPFFTTKPVGEGTGLGLSISHGIITGHGGRIEVKSEPGKGSTFTIFLPLKPRATPA